MTLSKVIPVDEKVITCELCSETFKSPKILPCLHSFCEQCICDLIASFVKNNHDRKILSFNCPVCRSLIKPKLDPDLDVAQWTASLRGNYIVEIMISKNDGTEILCHTCQRFKEKSQAIVWCPVCDESMCENCLTMHNRMKLLQDHHTIQIDEIELTNGYDFNVISEKCCHHSPNKMDHFCMDHDDACCSFCLRSTHLKCEIKSIKDILSDDSAIYDNLHGKILTLQNAVKQVLKQREVRKANLQFIVNNTRNEAFLFVETLKSKLDELFESFKKELNVLFEKESTNMNVTMRLVEQLIKTLDHWTLVVDKGYSNLTKTQLFVIANAIKKQLHSSIKEISLCLDGDDVIALNLGTNELTEIQASDVLCYVDVKRESNFRLMEQVYECCHELGIQFYPSYANLCVKHIRSIHINNGKVVCGVCIDKQLIIVGDNHETPKLHLLNAKTGVIIETCAIENKIKRVCFLPDTNKLFVSCYDKKVYMTKILENKISDPVKLNFINEFVGGLCHFDNHIYVIVDGAIKRFGANCDHDDIDPMTNVLTTNTSSSKGFSSLILSAGKLVYTTSDNGVDCTSLDGKKSFTLKRKEMLAPRGLVVTPMNTIIVLDRNVRGKLHLLDTVTTRHRLVLDQLENVAKPKDIWITEGGKTFFVAGGEHVDEYSVE